MVPSRLDFSPVAAAHEADGQELVQLGDARSKAMRGIEMRAGSELDIFLPVVHPVRHRHEARNPEIAGDVEHPKPASGFGKLGLQITDVGIVELVEVHFRSAAIDCTTRSRRNPAPPARGSPGRSPPRACCRPRSRWNPR